MLHIDQTDYMLIIGIFDIIKNFDPRESTEEDVLVLKSIKKMFDEIAEKLKHGARIDNKAGHPSEFQPRDELGRFTFKNTPFKKWEVSSKDLKMPKGMEKLTPREYEVAHLVAAGLDNEEIAKELDTVTDTAKAHVSAILRKLNVKNRTAAAGVLMRHNIINHELFDILIDRFSTRDIYDYAY